MMKKTAMLLAEGFEEVEALTAVDLLRRAGIACDLVALDGTGAVTGSHSITVKADRSFAGTDFSDYDGVILPGGMPGTNVLREDQRVLDLLRAFSSAGKLTAAICAAPTVLARAGLLTDRAAVCYPGLEYDLWGARVGVDPVAVDGTIITSRGVGTAIPFALALVEYFEGAERAKELARAIVYR